MDSFLKNKAAEKKLQSEGFVVIDFLLENMKSEISNLLAHHLPLDFDAFHTTHFSENAAYKKKVHQAILEFCQASVLLHVAENFYPVFANFMLKKGAGNNPMPLHADWTYVDETQHQSYAIWIPLTDVSALNGHLCVIPYSQHISHAIRGPGMLQWEFPANEILIQKAGCCLDLKVGQAVVYNHRLLHYSPPNSSNQLRAAINISFVPKMVSLLHYCVPENTDSIHLFDASVSDFYFHYNNFQMPEKAKLIKKLTLSAAPMWNDKTAQFLQKYYSKKWWEKWF